MPVVVQIVGEVVEGHGKVGGVGGWVVLDQGPVEVGGFLGGCEGLAPLAVLGLTLGEVVEGAGEVGGVDRWVVLRQGSVGVRGVSRTGGVFLPVSR